MPYLLGNIPRKYLPDFIVKVHDGHHDPLNPISFGPVTHHASRLTPDFAMPAKPKSTAKAAKGKTVATLRHGDKRKNLPIAEYESLMRQEDKASSSATPISSARTTPTARSKPRRRRR